MHAGKRVPTACDVHIGNAAPGGVMQHMIVGFVNENADGIKRFNIFKRVRCRYVQDDAGSIADFECEFCGLCRLTSADQYFNIGMLYAQNMSHLLTDDAITTGQQNFLSHVPFLLLSSLIK